MNERTQTDVEYQPKYICTVKIGEIRIFAQVIVFSLVTIRLQSDVGCPVPGKTHSTTCAVTLVKSFIFLLIATFDFASRQSSMSADFDSPFVSPTVNTQEKANAANISLLENMSDESELPVMSVRPKMLPVASFVPKRQDYGNLNIKLDTSASEGKMEAWKYAHVRLNLGFNRSMLCYAFAVRACTSSGMKLARFIYSVVTMHACTGIPVYMYTYHRHAYMVGFNILCHMDR